MFAHPAPGFPADIHLESSEVEGGRGDGLRKRVENGSELMVNSTLLVVWSNTYSQNHPMSAVVQVISPHSIKTIEQPYHNERDIATSVCINIHIYSYYIYVYLYLLY